MNCDHPIDSLITCAEKYGLTNHPTKLASLNQIQHEMQRNVICILTFIHFHSFMFVLCLSLSWKVCFTMRFDPNCGPQSLVCFNDKAFLFLIVQRLTVSRTQEMNFTYLRGPLLAPAKLIWSTRRISSQHDVIKHFHTLAPMIWKIISDFYNYLTLHVFRSS